MRSRARLPIRFSTLAALVGLACLGHSQTGQRMRAHFIDVGQGSATLLEFRCGAVLIDAGAAETTNRGSLKRYLDRFFRLRPDLGRTLDAVFLTHCHADHALGLEEVVANYRVRNFVDNGVRAGSGKRFLDRMLDHNRRRGLGIPMRGVFDREVRGIAGSRGISDAAIDPLRCQECDPDLRVLAGGFRDGDAPDGWSATASRNYNNHSLVLKASLGESSVLITGDLETEGIERLTGHYGSGDALETDVLVAGHHGSRNGLTYDLVRLASPEVGIISCGRWDDGRNGPGRFNTWNYGHPNRGVVETLSAGVFRDRPPVTVKVGSRARTFSDMTVGKAVYATAWDGSIVVDAYEGGQISVKRHGLVESR